MRALVAAGLAFAVAGLAATPASAAEYCETRVVNDYAAPLAALPPVPPIPAGKSALPFGPRGVSLSYLPPGQVLIVGSEGVELTLTADSGRRRPARLGWLVTASMVKVGEDGSFGGVVDRERRRVRKLSRRAPVRLSLGFGGEPGYFRIEISFRNRAGKRIGRLGEYVRVLAGNLDVRVSPGRATVHPGETISPTLANYGAAYLTFGLAAPIEVMQGGAWVPAPFGNVPVPGLMIVIGPGRAASCWPREIPADAAPGTYRIGIPYTYQTRAGRLPIGSGQTQYAEFQVVPAG